mgnify:CR=1 FL=1
MLAGVKQAALVGHSMGSLISLETASRYPDRVAKIALVGTAVPMPVSEALLTAAREARPKAEGMVNVWSHGPRGAIGGSTVPGLWLMGAIPAGFVIHFNWANLGQLCVGAFGLLAVALMIFHLGLRRYESGSAIQVEV